MFHSNVQLYTQALKDKINELKPGHTDVCVQKEIEIRIDGEKKTYICKTCVGHMRKKKLPPMSAMNGLQLAETDEMIKKEGPTLTELVAALIAKIQVECLKRQVDKYPNQ